MTRYRWIAAERTTMDGIDYWRLMFDVVGGGEGDVILAPDPLPSPFDAFDRERFYTDEELDSLPRRAT